MEIEPGTIYMADLLEGGRHPVIVVSRRELNRGRYLIVVICTSAKYDLRKNLPNNVPFNAGDFGLTRDCVAQCENILSIDRSSIDPAQPVGRLDDERFRDVIRAIGYVMDSDCEPA